MKKNIKIAIILFILTVIGLYACGGSKNNGQNKAFKGQKVYQQYCQNCHGTDGQLALGGAANLATSKMNHADMINIVTNGKGLMVAYKSQLSAAQIEAVAQYIEGFKGK